MKMSHANLVVIPLALLLVTGLSGIARADGYVGVGVGAAASLEGSIADNFTTNENTNSARILVGKRFEALAIEASIFGTQLQGASSQMGSGDFSTVSVGVDAKYYLPLITGFEGYAKLGLNKTWLAGPSTGPNQSYQGRGQEVGLGLQYTFPLPAAEVSLWGDYTIQDTTLGDGTQASLDGSMRMLTLGASFGF